MTNLWTKAKDDLRPDGALRDIYILQTSEKDWDQFLRYVKIHAADVRFFMSGEERPCPVSASSLLCKPLEQAPLLSFRIGEVLFTCHFFTDSEIECSFAPNDVTSEAKFAAVVEFMKTLGKTLRKEIVLTPENCKENPILKYEAITDSVKFCPDECPAG